MLRIFTSVCLIILLSSCEKWSHTPNLEYQNSFEKPGDISGLQGFPELSADVPPGGGDSSLYVSGGCEWPHVWIELGPWKQARTFEVRFWAKAFQQGQVSLYLSGDPSEKIQIAVDDTVWTHYLSGATLKCPAHETITLEMNSGGISFDAMWLDELEIIRIK